MGDFVFTDIQRTIILALAECDLKIERVAKKLYRNKGGVYYHIEKIKKLTGKDPRKFYDLVDLLQMIKEG